MKFFEVRLGKEQRTKVLRLLSLALIGGFFYGVFIGSRIGDSILYLIGGIIVLIVGVIIILK